MVLLNRGGTTATITAHHAGLGLTGPARMGGPHVQRQLFPVLLTSTTG
ncbi:hypothetical protein [Amycolatopsis sp. cmx-4-61]